MAKPRVMSRNALNWMYADFNVSKSVCTIDMANRSHKVSLTVLSSSPLGDCKQITLTQIQRLTLKLQRGLDFAQHFELC